MQLTILRYGKHIKGPYLDTCKGTPGQLYDWWFEHLSPTTQRELRHEWFGLVFPEPEDTRFAMRLSGVQRGAKG